MPHLEFHNVSLYYDTKGKSSLVLDQIQLTIQEGEFITIVGPSGCGKSTLLKLAAGVLFPSNGEVLFHQEKIRGMDSKRGMIFQDPTLYPWLTAKDNIAFGLKMKKIPKIEHNLLVQQYLERLGLQSFGNYYPYELSGGMKQRVALARTLINEPELILMDEPFAALDTITKINMQGLLLQLWETTKKTILFVTHDIDEAIYLGTRIIVMSPKPGTIIQDMILEGTNKVKREDISILFS